MDPSTKPTAGAVPKVGDRLEQAIVRHADLEHELALEIAREEAAPPDRRRMIRSTIWLVILGVSVTIVAPSVIALTRSWHDIQGLGLGWLVAMAALQGGALLCLGWVQWLTVHGASWRAITTSQLAGNALAKIAPGGGAMGAALQFRMLTKSGVAPASAVSGLTTANLLVFAVVLAMPVVALPAIIRGFVPKDLVAAAISGVAVFTLLGLVGGACLAWDRPLVMIGTGVQRARNALRRKTTPLTGLPDVLLRERDQILTTLGPSWHWALVATLGRWAFDYATLLAALAAVGSYPRPAVVLLAFCAAQILAQIPITPGGLGFVEAGLTATLTLAGVSPGDAAIATFTYRIFSYWLPLPVGLAAYLVGRRGPGPSGPGDPSGPAAAGVAPSG